uniref:Putative conserved secreted protein n=1 Tax=Rhipicephalus microplus TaxID=6941 RepID=A0A6G5A5E0_RHIMP
MMPSMWTMICSLWLLCPTVLADDIEIHTCMVQLAGTAWEECTGKYVKKDDDKNQSLHDVVSRIGRDFDCFFIVYGRYTTDCFNVKKFTKLVLCWWDKEPDTVQGFNALGVYSRIQAERIARKIGECIAEKNHTVDKTFLKRRRRKDASDNVDYQLIRNLLK